MNSAKSVPRGQKDFRINHILRLAKLIYFAASLALFLFYFNKVLLRYGEACHFAHPKAFVLFTVIYFLVLLWLIRIYNGFYFGFSGLGELVFSQSISTTAVNLLMYVLICIYLNSLTGIVPLLLLSAADVLNNLLFSCISQRIYFHYSSPRRTAVIYRSRSDLAKLGEIYLYPHYFDLCLYIENPLSQEDIIPGLKDIDIVILAGISPQVRGGVLKYCIRHGIQVYIEPNIGDVILAGSRRAIGFSIPVMKVNRVVLKPEFEFFKRFTDIIISLAAIIIMSPFMLAAAVLIKAEDGGPVLYRQTRLTRGGREFEIMKFRSMRVDAEGDGVARLASENDSRITRTGHFLRSCRMDELPQLFNVLKGDMSIVGPRPERPEIARRYMEDIPCFDLRLQVKAGITGFAQVYGRYNTEPYDKLQMDLMYINSISILSDLWLMLATFKVLFQKESSSGVEAGRVTAAPESSRTDSASAGDDSSPAVPADAPDCVSVCEDDGASMTPQCISQAR